MASKIDFGIICSIKFCMENDCVLSVTSEAVETSISERLSPTPG